MGRISATLSGIERSLLNRLAEANAAATQSTLRLATGAKINSPSDDPVAFTRLSELQGRLSNVRSAMTNATAAGSMITQTQSAIDQIQVQLGNIRTELLTDEDGSLTQAERDEAQANIDTAIATINTLASTQIDGRRMLDGSANFNITGRNSAQVEDVRVYSTTGSTLTIDANVTTAATQGQLVYTGDASDQVTDTAEFTLSGSLGSVDVSVTAGQSLSSVASEINENSHETGVTATVDGGTHTLTFSTVDYGTDATVEVDVTTAPFVVAGTGIGTEAEVTIDGQSYTGEGNLISVIQNGVHYTLDLDPSFTGNIDTITVQGDALTFTLSDDLRDGSTLSIPSLRAVHLGGDSGALNDLLDGGSLSGLDTNTSQAIRVVDEALAEVTVVEGAVDGFYDAAVSSASTLLSDMETDLMSAIDDVNLVDSTEEAQSLAYYQALGSNAVSGLAILSQQRDTIVTMIKAIAGLT